MSFFYCRHFPLAEIDECEVEPCLNGGNCTDLLADYACDCVTGWDGHSCEISKVLNTHFSKIKKII